MNLTNILDLQMRSVLSQLEILSHGSTTSYDSGGGGEVGHVILHDGKSKSQLPPHEYYRDRYDRQDNDIRRQRVIDEARRELNDWRGGEEKRRDLERTRSPLSDAQILDAQILDAEGFSVSEVSTRYRCTETRVRNVRKANARMVGDGSKVLPPADGADVSARVLEIASRGNKLTQRQIAMFARVSQTTVHRILRRAA